MTTTKIKYITNKDLLSEIHRSKNTYCSFVNEEVSGYDAIVSDVSSITPELIDLTRVKRAAQLMAVERARQKLSGIKNYAISIPIVDPMSIPIDKLVFRVMTYEHIPLDPDRKRKNRNTDQSYSKTNFPPFKHYVIDGAELTEVGRSHWLGSISNGKFDPQGGRMSPHLARMFMMLVERYSRRGNWRGYCVDQETEALTTRGWLRHDQITEKDTILSYKDGQLKWSSIKSIYRNHYNGPMFHLTVAGMDALVTPGHKFVTKAGLREVELLRETDNVILTGKAVDGATTPIYSDEFVEIAGWVATEGSIYKEAGRNYHRVSIFQNEGEYADRIRKCLTTLGHSFGESSRVRTQDGNYNACFTLSKGLCDQIMDVIDIDGKTLKMPFLLSLTNQQREILIHTMLDADGHRSIGSTGKRTLLRYNQKSLKHVDAFVTLCTLHGLRTSVKRRETISYGKPSFIHDVTIFSRVSHARVENINFHGGKRNGTIKGRGKHMHPNEPTVPYDGQVWCPETEFGSFIARRNGYVFLTGNSYVDEMRSHALLQLSQIGLQFDESKSANPFAFYTTAIKNCLAGETTILTREHGSVPIADVSEQDVTLLDGDNQWVKCHIYDHGKQETHRMFFQNGGGTKVELWSTAEHGWISDEGEKVYTKDFLGKNTRIGDLRPRKTVTSQESYHQGIAHGIIYGDGSNEYGDRYTIRLCAEKIELAPFFKRYPVHHYPSFNGDPLYVVHSDIDLKALPENPGGDLDYLLGFFRGWFATDGCVSKATTPALCGDIAEHAWLTKWGPLVGWHVNGFTKLNEVTNFGRRKKVSLNFHLRKSSMDADDFLRSQHRDRWLTRPETRKGKETGRKYDWALVESLLAQGRSTAGVADKLGVKVGSLRSALCQHRKSKVETGRVWHVYGSRQEPASRMERVYCPVVETTQSFALSDGIHTSNCFTRILNLEKKNQSIRDDLLLLAGAGPSYTRQVENDLEYRLEDEQRAKAKGKAGA